MKRLFMILLIAVLCIGGAFTISYSDQLIAYADSDQQDTLFILSGSDSGIREIPLSSLRFDCKDMNKEIEWYFTPIEEKMLSVMSLDQKIGQLFIVRPESLSGGSGKLTSMTDALRKGLSERMPAGIIMFGENITDPSQIKAFNEDLHMSAYLYSTLPLMIAVDEEGGLVARIANNPNFSVPEYDSMLSVGNTGDPVNAFKAGLAIGTYLKACSGLLHEPRQQGDRRQVIRLGPGPRIRDGGRVHRRSPFKGNKGVLKALPRPRRYCERFSHGCCRDRKDLG